MWIFFQGIPQFLIVSPNVNENFIIEHFKIG